MSYYLARRIVLVLVCSLPLLLASGCQGRWSSSQASHVPVLPDAEPWTFGVVEGWVIETPHYRIYTTVGDALLLEKLPTFLETAYEQYLAFLPQAQDDEEPLEIYLFNRRSEWEDYTRENMGSLAENYLKIRAGGYSYSGISVVYLLDRYHTFGVLAHEGFHQFANSRLVHRIPAWMEEGLACNFEAHFWRAGKPDFAPDLNEFRIKALQQALRRDSLFPLSEILAMDAGQAVALSPEKTATFYAQSWALTRFLQEGRTGKYRSALHRMLRDAADGANLYSQSRAVQIFESYFQEDLESIAEDFVWYARFLADRKIRPGTEVYLVGPGETEQTIMLTAEQIEQTKPDRTGQPAVTPITQEPPEQRPEGRQPRAQGESPEPRTELAGQDDRLIIRIHPHQQSDKSE